LAMFVHGSPTCTEGSPPQCRANRLNHSGRTVLLSANVGYGPVWGGQ
jgi:hypothetical protein